MEQTRHFATAGPNAKKSAHMMKTTTAGIGIDDGSGGSSTGTSYTRSAAAAPG